MEVTLLSNKAKTKKKVEQDFYWYDPDSQQTYHGRGGRMEFVYNPDLKKSYPKIIDDEKTVYSNNYDKIIAWVRHNQEEYDFEITEEVPGYRVVLEVDKHNLDNVTQDLYSNGILFDF